jgi:hypothetical protein
LVGKDRLDPCPQFVGRAPDSRKRLLLGHIGTSSLGGGEDDIRLQEF